MFKDSQIESFFYNSLDGITDLETNSSYCLHVLICIYMNFISTSITFFAIANVDNRLCLPKDCKWETYFVIADIITTSSKCNLCWQNIW